jgi:2-polyprenyl-6-methoxyphenol hydroxylase-like FAD-dependent oxidoreductase
MRHFPVIIAGGGPVGMTLARDLARRGIRTLLVERNPTTTRHPKMDITNARSMELFHRLGLADGLRAVAVPEANNFDVSWITGLSGYELHRFHYPSVTQWRQLIRDKNDGSMPSEPPMRVSQVEIEPVLARAIRAEPLIDARWSAAFVDLVQDLDGVTVTLRPDGGAVEQLRCDYLVGCDGGTSDVRHCLGIGLDGQAFVQQRFMTHFRSRAREVLMPWGIAWHYQSLQGTLIAQNDRDIWTLQTRWPNDTPPAVIDPGALLRAFAGRDFGHEILVANSWTSHLLVAQSYQHGRVFLAGDAAHQYIPTGGYGMNTGIGDACDLGWKLAAVLHGFASPDLLAAYDAERRPIGVRNRDAAARHTKVRGEIAQILRADLTEPGPAGDAARADAGKHIATLGNAENESFGVEFGYAYLDSPIVCTEPNAEIPGSALDYVPSTVPGVRLPSVLLGDGASIYDRLGPWFTLLSCGVEPSAALLTAAGQQRMPLSVLRVDEAGFERVYGRGLILVRPDQHIAWRGRSCDDTRAARAIIGRALGWATL